MLVLKLQVFQNDDEEMVKLVRISLMRGNSELMVRPCAATLLSVIILFRLSRSLSSPLHFYFPFLPCPPVPHVSALSFRSASFQMFGSLCCCHWLPGPSFQMFGSLCCCHWLPGALAGDHGSSLRAHPASRRLRNVRGVCPC
jgi:hypothetical protein